MHMPGGKRNIDICAMQNPYSMDITEIDGFDNLHNPTGIIKDGFKRAAKLFGAKETLFDKWEQCRNIVCDMWHDKSWR